MYKIENNEGMYFHTLRIEVILVKMMSKKGGWCEKNCEKRCKKH